PGVVGMGVWGLDWAVALRRPDMISTDLTAKFLRIADQLDHQAAADFVSRSLNQLSPEADWPAVMTTAAANAPRKTGEGNTVYPLENVFPDRGQGPVSNAWPRTLGVYTELERAGWPTNSMGAVPMKTPTGSPRDITLFLWTAAAFYLAIIVAALFWWALSWAR